jgi:predicted lipid-binding transport protein (Tim44 family)
MKKKAATPLIVTLVALMLGLIGWSLYRFYSEMQAQQPQQSANQEVSAMGKARSTPSPEEVKARAAGAAAANQQPLPQHPSVLRVEEVVTKPFVNESMSSHGWIYRDLEEAQRRREQRDQQQGQ